MEVLAQPPNSSSRGINFISITRYGVLKKKPARGGLKKNILRRKKPALGPVAFVTETRSLQKSPVIPEKYQGGAGRAVTARSV